MDWKTEAGDAMCALLRVNPWLAYGVAEGARLAIRKPEETEGWPGLQTFQKFQGL